MTTSLPAPFWQRPLQMQLSLRNGNAEVALELLAAGADVTLPDAQVSQWHAPQAGFWQ